jgi:hypothetical protein
MQETEKRLKDLVSGKSNANGVVSANGVKKAPVKHNRQQMLIFTVTFCPPFFCARICK